jgi:hypothetical protein
LNASRALPIASGVRGCLLRVASRVGELRCTGYKGNFGSHRRFMTLHATITGVGFWDVEHGTPQKGRAPNDLELHPVLKFSRAKCD